MRPRQETKTPPNLRQKAPRNIAIGALLVGALTAPSAWAEVYYTPATALFQLPLSHNSDQIKVSAVSHQMRDVVRWEKVEKLNCDKRLSAENFPDSASLDPNFFREYSQLRGRYHALIRKLETRDYWSQQKQQEEEGLRKQLIEVAKEMKNWLDENIAGVGKQYAADIVNSDCLNPNVRGFQALIEDLKACGANGNRMVASILAQDNIVKNTNQMTVGTDYIDAGDNRGCVAYEVLEAKTKTDKGASLQLELQVLADSKGFDFFRNERDSLALTIEFPDASPDKLAVNPGNLGAPKLSLSAAPESGRTKLYHSYEVKPVGDFSLTSGRDGDYTIRGTVRIQGSRQNGLPLSMLPTSDLTCRKTDKGYEISLGIDPKILGTQGRIRVQGTLSATRRALTPTLDAFVKQDVTEAANHDLKPGEQKLSEVKIPAQDQVLTRSKATIVLPLHSAPRVGGNGWNGKMNVFFTPKKDIALKGSEHFDNGTLLRVPGETSSIRVPCLAVE
jgi:hypothetical protein